MKISAQMVRELRDATDAPMMDCKKALEETGGDVKAAIDVLRKRGISKAAKKAGREMSEGRVGAYIHFNGKLGAMVEMQCETDFCSKSEEFVKVLDGICMHVAASDPVPLSIGVEGLPSDALENERVIYEAQAKDSGKPEQFWPKIVEGRLDKYRKEHALLEQPYVSDPDKTVGQVIAELVGRLGENISIARFARFKIGE